jgi:hypothetical protein
MSTFSKTLMLVVAAGALIAFGCGHSEPSKPTGGKRGARAPLEGTRLVAFLDAHTRGLGYMEQFEYAKATQAFRQALELAPDSIPTKVNLAIALLNDTGNKAEDAKKKGAGGAPPPTNFDEAIELLDAVVAVEPENLRAHYCLGLILEYQGEIERAHAEFQAVVEGDPDDANAWVKYGMTLPNPDRPGFPAGPESADKLVEIYAKAFERKPTSVLAAFKLQEAYNWLSVTRKDSEAARKRDELKELWLRLNRTRAAAGPGDFDIDSSYGSVGKYALVDDPFGPRRDRRAGDLRMPRFEAPKALAVALPEGDRWTGPDVFQKVSNLGSPIARIGAMRARFGAGICHFDANGDGRLDLFLASGVESGGTVRDVLLINQGDGAFTDASSDFGLVPGEGNVAAVAADFDADQFTDLLLVGPRGLRLLRNVEGKRYEDVTSLLGEIPADVQYSGARWADLDQDGDLDLIVLGFASQDAAGTSRGAANLVFRNDGVPPRIENEVAQNYAPLAVAPAGLKVSEGLSLKFTAWTGPDVEALIDGTRRHTGIALADFDGDRDLDLILTADDGPPTLVVNDRLGRFHAFPLADLDAKGPVNGAAVLDLDKDGRSDVVLILPDGRMTAWRGSQPKEFDRSKPPVSFEFWPTDAARWRSASTVDLDLDTWTDLVGLPASGTDVPPAPAWARNDGSRLAVQDLALPPLGTEPLVGLDLADIAGDALPELILLHEGSPPRWLGNAGNGCHWLALSLSGRWKFGFDWMRSNSHGTGASLTVQGANLSVPATLTPAATGPGQSVGPLVLGLGSSTAVPLVRVRWPDGVLQAELNLPIDQFVSLTEFNRRMSSCPVLFAYDGRRYQCIGDFLGGGGLGYLVAPGVYGTPDRDEAVAIRVDQLRPVSGEYRISVTEPMDEVAYIDQLELEVIDRPPGIDAAPEERFAPGGNRPSGKLIAWRSTIHPERATDLEGRDVSEALQAFDGRTVDGFRKLRGWTGYAEEHGIVLDFADRLARFDPSDRLVLCLAGWVEYPYSQTNYAAATAGVPLQPPVLERQNPDGSWSVLEPDPGYPAGLPRLTTLELTGKLAGPSCVLRIRTNMECYYDQSFIAVVEAEPGLIVTRLPVSRANLGYRGYTREASPDGRLPLLYDYEHVDPAPLAQLKGRLTRYGDVRPLLLADDDQLCLVAPGDEILIGFDASSVPTLAEGWSRGYVLRSVGYCKDADPFTAGSDTVGPLPWKGMPEKYPFGAEGDRPRVPAYDDYLRTYQTREVRPD